ncbi:MAG: amidase [Rubricella sp.]
MADFTTMTAEELGRSIGLGRIDPVDLTEAFLTAAGAHEHGASIYARLTPERARSEAMAARDRARNGDRRHPLDGVPISWKDLFDTKGIATEAGSALLAGRVPEADAEVLARATANGLTCLGKTHMSELAFSGLGLNPVTATAPNRNFPGHAPGGSSSGAAASVAYGLAPAAIGSDTGGSVRVPAAWNDLVGLKTTSGLLPLDGCVKLAPGFDTIGPICRTVTDAALLLDALGARAVVEEAPDRPLRLLVLETAALDGLRPEPARAFEDALDRIGASGAEIDHSPFPDLTPLTDLSGILFGAEAWAECGALIETAPEKMFPPIRKRFEGGKGALAADYLQAVWRMAEVRRNWLAFVEDYDAVLTPTCPILPPSVERLMTDEAFYTTENLLTLRNTRIGNLLGLCGLSLPTGHLSCGLQVLGQPFGEGALLGVGLELERILAG